MAHVVSIHIAPAHGAETNAVESVRAVAGRGLEGDRNFDDADATRDGRRELTLIESEAVGALRHSGIDIADGEARRNIVTTGVRLNELVGRQFAVGQSRLLGVKLCDPCGYLERLTAKGVREGLENRGGLRARILTDAVITVGDPIVTKDEG